LLSKLGFTKDNQIKLANYVLGFSRNGDILNLGNKLQQWEIEDYRPHKEAPDHRDAYKLTEWSMLLTRAFNTKVEFLRGRKVLVLLNIKLNLKLNDKVCGVPCHLLEIHLQEGNSRY